MNTAAAVLITSIAITWTKEMRALTINYFIKLTCYTKQWNVHMFGWPLFVLVVILSLQLLVD